MSQSRVRVGKIQQVSGEVNIAGRDVYKGYTAEQVSHLLAQITSTFQPKPFDGRCPYKGLDVFEEEDAEFFFGRERLVQDLTDRVKQARTVFVTGPSGSGKSSLVRAGLIPALKQGAIKNLHSERWCYETLKPGRSPIAELARVVSRLTGTLNAGEELRSKGLSDATVLSEWCEIALGDGRNKRVVIFIDQFEEVFTQVSNEEERQAFLNLLLHSVTTENGRVICLFAMRSDFVSNCAAYPGLNTLLCRQFLQIGAMQPDELVSAIAQPALRVGLRIGPDLIAQIIHEMEGEPGALPLIQFALKDLFDSEQTLGRLTALNLEDYLERGGIHKALERHADNEFSKFTKTEKVLAENLFKGLVEIGRNAPDTRRIAHFEDFATPDADPGAFESVVRRLADARLISTDEDQATGRTITLAHEKLIEAWPWLRQLIHDNRAFIQLQNQVIEDAMEWEKHGKDSSYLYAGKRLVGVQKKIHGVPLDHEKAQAFLRASTDAYRRGRWTRISLAGLLLLIGVAFYLIVIQPLTEPVLKLQPVDLGGAGVNVMQRLEDGTVFAGLYNNRIKGGAPCLALFSPDVRNWKKLGPTCTGSVAALWVNPADPGQIYFFHSTGPELHRTLDGGQKWEVLNLEDDLPMNDITSLAGTEEGVLFVGDFFAPVGVYRSLDQGQTWTALAGSPSTTIFTLLWVPGRGLLVGGNGGLWLWQPEGEWQQLIALDTRQVDQRVLSMVVLPTEDFTILAGGENGIYLWKEGDPIQRAPQNEVVKKAWSMVVVTKPEPYVLAVTFDTGKIWRMTLEGKDPVEWEEVGSEGLALIAQTGDPLDLWIGAANGLYEGAMRRKGSDLINSDQ